MSRDEAPNRCLRQYRNWTDCMSDDVDSDDLMQAWSVFRSTLNESGHRFNSQNAQRKFAGVKTHPQEILAYLMKNYERAAAMAIKTISDEESAVACGKTLDRFSTRVVRISSKLLPVLMPDASSEAIKTLICELRRRLLPRSEHWKAKGHRRARQLTKKGSAAFGKRPEAVPVAHSTEANKASPALQILRLAMEREGLNPPQLASRIHAMLRRTKQLTAKADRTTIYRI